MINYLLIGSINFNFPLKNPVLIFSLLLFIILFAPILLNKFKIPHIIGLIIAGAIIGPNAFNIMLRDSSIVLFGTVGLLYIMFLAGLEIDLADFKKNAFKSTTFGIYTFSVPIILGTLGGHYLLGFQWMSAILFGSTFSSHTLLAYPIISKLGVQKNRAVGITVGGTMITDTIALLVLAVIVGMATGQVTDGFWLKLSISVLLFALIVMLLFPVIARWFFKNFSDSISQYIFVLAMLFLSAFLAELAGIEPIIGAFLAGLALNRLVPSTSALMNRIEFVGNALFIPFFLIGVGMLIDFGAFFKNYDTIIVALFMTVTATVSKFIAAWLTQKTFKFTIDERRLIFGLSNAHVAALLAVLLVAYNVILGYTPSGEPIRLLNDSVLNGAVLMILVTCTIATFVAQKGATNIAVEEAAANSEQSDECDESILIPVHNVDSIEQLINLSLTIKSKNNKNGLFALNVVEDINQNEIAERRANKVLDKAASVASATENYIHKLIRYEFNIAHGISNVVKEYNITDLILGVHQKKTDSDTFLGSMTEDVLSKINCTTLIYKERQPLSTIGRHFVIIPQNAEKEIGFPLWIVKLWNIARNTGAKLEFYASEDSLKFIRELHNNNPIDAHFNVFDDWSKLSELSKLIKVNDNLIFIMSRRRNISYNSIMRKIPNYLDEHFNSNSYILIYPLQTGITEDK